MKEFTIGKIKQEAIRAVQRRKCGFVALGVAFTIEELAKGVYSVQVENTNHSLLYVKNNAGNLIAEVV